MSVPDEHLLSLQPGTIIGGRYEVIKCLGAGGMGLVYACRHRELSGHLVAVKVLFPEVAQDEVAATRFKNEITASYGISHPNVVRAYEFLRDGEILAYTMEFISGGDLAGKIEKQNPLPIPESIRLLSQMCAGVQAIHDAGIIHRDLKPENILLTKDGQVKIADFGIAKTKNNTSRLTEHGGVVGTLDYVSPEYMFNNQIDSRSDIYALGILAYEMVTGTSPFTGDSVYEVMNKRLKEEPKHPCDLRPDCPRWLGDIILMAMARDVEQRYQRASDIEKDLKAKKSSVDLSILIKEAQSEAPRPASSGASSTNDTGGYSAASPKSKVENPLLRQETNNLGGMQQVPNSPMSSAILRPEIETPVANYGAASQSGELFGGDIRNRALTETISQSQRSSAGSRGSTGGEDNLLKQLNSFKSVRSAQQVDSEPVRQSEIIIERNGLDMVDIMLFACIFMVGLGASFFILFSL